MLKFNCKLKPLDFESPRVSCEIFKSNSIKDNKVQQHIQKYIFKLLQTNFKIAFLKTLHKTC